MIDLLQLQRDIYALLMGHQALNTVNIVMERQFMVDAEVSMDAIWTTQRNERSGNGVLIETPKTKVIAPSIQDMPQDIELTLVAFQNGDAAFTPQTGSGYAAENLAQLTLSILHLQAIIGLGQLQGVGSDRAQDYDFINAQRATLRISGVRTPATPRCVPIQYDNTANVITLSCATAGSRIFYTTDGSSPCDPSLVDPIYNQPINPQAKEYTAPFAVNSGDRVRAVATAFGYNPSEIISKPIT